MPNPPSTLISSQAIQDRVCELGRNIDRDYPPNNPLVLIGVLRGAVYFFADLSRAISRDIEVDFISVSSYAGTKSTGKITLHQDIAIDIAGKDILIVEDIVDTGRTLNALIQHFQQQKPRSIRTCALLDKPSRREVSVSTHYLGFRISNHFVVGYGLDYEQAYRNLPYVGTLSAT